MTVDAAIQKYQALSCAVRLGSISAAAHELAYSQSGVSRMIADLEREWGFAVLERGRRGVRLTEDGALVMPFVEVLCEDHRRLTERVGEVVGLERGHITIGTFSSVATHVLPDAIGRFQAAHPAIEYELRMGDYNQIEEWVAEGVVDFGFLPYPPQTPREGLAREEVLVDELLAVMPARHELAAGACVTLADLCRDPFILLERGDNNEISPLFEAAGLTPATKLATWDDYAIMSMVENGLGISILPALILRRCPYAIETRPLEPAVTRSICAVFRPGLLSHAARAFLDCLTQGTGQA